MLKDIEQRFRNFFWFVIDTHSLRNALSKGMYMLMATLSFGIQNTLRNSNFISMQQLN